MLNDHKNRAHALLSASSSARWLKCPPSAVAATMYPNADTAFTREGTLAHEVAEAVAAGRIEPGNVETGETTGVTHEMVDCAESYRDYIHEQITGDGATVLLEQRLDFSPWVPDGFGTGDCLILQDRQLHVIDYKYGQGVAVSAINNPQMRLYGLGALNDYGCIYDIDEVVMHIFQPRLNSISVDKMTREELLAWGETVKPVAQLAAEGLGDYCSGEHCRFCPHAGACPHLASDCLRIVDLPDGVAKVPTLAPWMVADILQQEGTITAWLRAVKDRALGALLNGEDIPGFKVVEGKPGNRKWTDEAQVVAALDAAGVAREEYTETKLRSPASMDKVLGKKAAAELLADLIDRAPGTPTIAPESDKRKPLDRLAEARKDFE